MEKAITDISRENFFATTGIRTQWWQPKYLKKKIQSPNKILKIVTRPGGHKPTYKTNLLKGMKPPQCQLEIFV